MLPLFFNYVTVLSHTFLISDNLHFWPFDPLTFWLNQVIELHVRALPSLSALCFLQRFYPNVTTLRSGRFAIANPSVVCNVGTPYSRSWNFRQYFFASLYPDHPLTSVKNFTDVVLDELLRRGVKRKDGSTIERCHVRVFHPHPLISFLCS